MVDRIPREKKKDMFGIAKNYGGRVTKDHSVGQLILSTFDVFHMEVSTEPC